MCQAIASAGLVIERLIEPQPLEELAARDPVACERLRTQPRFLFFRLRSLQALADRGLLPVESGAVVTGLGREYALRGRAGSWGLLMNAFF
jgi:hypothetical protein